MRVNKGSLAEYVERKIGNVRENMEVAGSPTERARLNTRLTVLEGLATALDLRQRGGCKVTSGVLARHVNQGIADILGDSEALRSSKSRSDKAHLKAGLVAYYDIASTFGLPRRRKKVSG